MCSSVTSPGRATRLLRSFMAAGVGALSMLLSSASATQAQLTIDSSTTINSAINQYVYVGYNNTAAFTVSAVSGAKILSPYSVNTYHQATLNYTGAQVDFTNAYDSSHVNIYSGSYAAAGAYNSSTVNVYGGQLFYSFGSSLIASNTGTASLYGGTVRGAESYLSGTLNIAGGTVGIVNDSGQYGVIAHDTSVVNITSGTVLYGTTASNKSTVNVTGGTLANIFAQDSSKVNVTGGSFVDAYASGQGTVNFGGTAQANYAFTYNSSAKVNISGGTINNNAGSYSGTAKVTGGIIKGYLSALGSGFVNLVGGDVKTGVYGTDTAFVEIDGGNANGLFTEGSAFGYVTGGTIGGSGLYDNSAVYMTGTATLLNLDTFDTSSFTMTGGTITDYLAGNNNSTIDLYDGYISELQMHDSAVANIYGGTIGPNTLISFSNAATINLFGTNLMYANPMAGIEDGIVGYFWDITGTLQNGDALSTRYFEAGSNGTIHGLTFNGQSLAAPEPGTLAFVLPAFLGCMIFVRRRRA